MSHDTPSPAAAPDWCDAAGLTLLDDAARARLAPLAPMSLPARTPLFHAGDAAQGYAIVLSGRIDVTLTGASGREILLYTVEPGQSCVQTTMGLISDRNYSADAQTVTDTRLVLVPKPTFTGLLNDSASFRSIVFDAFAQRMQAMTELLEKVAFMRAECRIAERLLTLAAPGPIQLTQAGLAAQVGTAREVVSRRLDAWSRNGWVRTGRGTVEVLNPDALRGIALKGD